MLLGKMKDCVAGGTESQYFVCCFQATTAQWQQPTTQTTPAPLVTTAPWEHSGGTSTPVMLARTTT